MKRLAACALVLMLVVASTAAEDAAEETAAPVTVDLVCFGTPARQALAEFAEKAKLELDTGGNAIDDAPVWLSVTRVSPERGARLLATATGISVQVSGKKLMVRDEEHSASLRVTRGYDVSLLAGRFVEYVKAYGHPRASAESTKSLQTGAEMVGELLNYVMNADLGIDQKCSVVGDRILVTAQPSVHAHISELLNLLAKDGGAESESLRGGRTQAERLEKHSGAYAAEDRPLGSVVSGLCRAAAADFVVEHSLAGFFSEEHTVLNGNDSHGVLLRALIRQGEYDFEVHQRHGVLCFVEEGNDASDTYRVFDADRLLKRLDQAYQRQATPGAPASMREAGGVEAVAKALRKALDERDIHGRVLTFATRIIVTGSPETTDASADILKELGWESPDKEGKPAERR